MMKDVSVRRIWCECECNNKCWHSKMELCVQMTSNDEGRSLRWNEQSELKMNNTQENIEIKLDVGTDASTRTLNMEMERVVEIRREREKEWPHKNASIWQITAIACYIWMMSACVCVCLILVLHSFFLYFCARQSWTIRLVSFIDRYKRRYTIHISVA